MIYFLSSPSAVFDGAMEAGRDVPAVLPELDDHLEDAVCQSLAVTRVL